MSTTIPQPPAADLAEIDRDFPGWHAWLSDAGRPNATHSLTPQEITAQVERTGGMNVGTGYTVDAASIPLLRQEIARYLADSLAVA